MTDSDLFNCCTNGAAPDWSQFDALEIGGCINAADDEEKARGETFIEGGHARAEAEFFTVYGHFRRDRGEGVEALTDCDTYEQAEAAAAELSRLSGLPINVLC